MIGKWRSESYELHKLMLSSLILLFVVPMIIMSLVLYKKSETSIRANASSYTVQMLNKTNKAIDLTLQSYAENATFILNPEVQRLALQARSQPLDGYQTKLLYDVINRAMTDMISVTSMSMHRLDGKVLVRDEFPGPSVLPQSVIDEAIALNGSIYWRLSPESVRGRPSVQAVRLIKNMRGPEPLPLALISFTVPEEIIYAMIEDLDFGVGGNVVVFDRAGQLLSSQHRDTDPPSDYSVIWHSLRDTQGTEMIKWRGERQFVAHNRSDRTGLHIAGIVPQSQMTPGLSDILRSGAFWATLLLLLAVLIAYWITRSVVNPIRKLVRAMHQIEKRDTYLEVEAASPKEIKFLTATFNKMTDRLHELIEEEKRAQLKLLESQINPHFLYNTLDTIYWMLYLKGEEEIGGIVVSTANILRYGIARNDQSVTLKDELDNIRDYLHIQQARYGEQLSYEIDAAPATLPTRAIKLMLQPLVENAVKHGIESGGFIRVTAERVGDEIHIHIMDNGKGLPADMEDKLAHNRLNGYGLGLFNVHDRIRITFGESYGLQIVRSPQPGACIKLILPYWVHEGEKADVQTVNSGR